MSDNNFTSKNCITNIENNQFEFFDEMSKVRGKKELIGEDVSWTDKCIYRIKFTSVNVDQRIEQIKDQILQGNVPRLWFTGPSSQPDDLENRLEANGFERKYECAGMALDLEEINTGFDKPEGVQIQEVCEDDILREWARVVVNNLFMGNEDDVEPFFKLSKELIARGKFKCYAAIYYGNVTAASAMFLSKSTAGIYFVATQKEYRNKGLGRHITLAPLLDAKNTGIRTAILQATDLGKIIYEKIGFKEYCKLGRYVLVQ